MTLWRSASRAYIASERFLLPESDSLLFWWVGAGAVQIIRETAVSSCSQPSFNGRHQSLHLLTQVVLTPRMCPLARFLLEREINNEQQALIQSKVDKFPNDWSRDGKSVLYTQDTNLWFMTLPDLKSSLFLKAPSVLRNGQFSPDGKWVAYASNETEKWQIYVTSFPDARGKWQVSTEGGEQPRWRGMGKSYSIFLRTER